VGVAEKSDARHAWSAVAKGEAMGEGAANVEMSRAEMGRQCTALLLRPP
jgi:hypothetical protein